VGIAEKLVKRIREHGELFRLVGELVGKLFCVSEQFFFWFD